MTLVGKSNGDRDFGNGDTLSQQLFGLVDAELLLIGTQRQSHVLMENPNMGRTEQFTEVNFEVPQVEGAIVTAKIVDIAGTRLVAAPLSDRPQAA